RLNYAARCFIVYCFFGRHGIYRGIRYSDQAVAYTQSSCFYARRDGLRRPDAVYYLCPQQRRQLSEGKPVLLPRHGRVGALSLPKRSVQKETRPGNRAGGPRALRGGGGYTPGAVRLFLTTALQKNQKLF